MLMSCSAPKESNELITDAKAFLAKGDNKSAVITLKNIIKNTPKNGEARFILGKIYVSQGDYLNADKELNKALELNYESFELFILLAENYLASNKFDETITLLENKEFPDSKTKIRSFTLLGQAFLAKDNTEKAELNFNKANKIDPKAPNSMLGQALIESYYNNNAQALNILEKLIASNKDTQEAWLLKGSIESKENKFSLAADSFAEYVKLKPNSFNVKSLVAHNLIRAEKYALAQDIINDLLKLTTEHPTINLLAAQLALVDKDYKQAKLLANKVLNATNNGLAQMISGLSDYYLGNNEQAYYSLNAIVDALPKNHKIHQVLAVLQLKLGYTDELQLTLDNMNNDNIESAELFANIGTSLARQGNIEGANQLFDRAVNASPDDARLKTQQGILKIINTDSSGELDLKEAISIEPSLKEANIALAMTYLKQNKIINATKIADAWLEKAPNNVNALLLRGNIAIKNNANEAAKQYFTRAIAADSGSITPLYNLAVVYSNEKNDQASFETLEKLLIIDKEYAPAYRLLITNAIRLKQEELLIEKINNIARENPTSIWPRLVLSRRFNNESKFTEANEVLESLSDYSSLPNVYFSTLVNNYLSQKKFSKIDTLFAQWQKAQPENFRAFTMQIELFDKQKKYQQALEAVQSALSNNRHKNNFQIKAYESYFLLLTGQLEQAKSTVSILAKSKPSNSFILRIQGQIALATSDFHKAKNYLAQSYQLNNNTFTGLYLANSHKALGAPQAAIDFLEKELEKHPERIAYQKLLAESYIALEPNLAVQHYVNLVEKNTNDVVSLNNLAWILYQDNKLDQAQQYALKALKVAPKNPKILDTLGVILLQKQDFDAALDTLNRAYELHNKDSEIIVHLAQAYKAKNNDIKVKELISRLTEADKEKWKIDIDKL
jgi:putative PEP-CTERM system TPR-repeat lipoprotein